VFDAVWTKGASTVKAVLTITVTGNNVHVVRGQGTDGNNCDYRGTLAANGRDVSGSFQCNGVNYTWTASIASTTSLLDTSPVWHEQENGWDATWTRRGTTKVFDAVWTKGGGTVKAVLTITVTGNSVHVVRGQGTDGNNCEYTGTLAANGKDVSGAFQCNGVNYVWSATL